MGANTFTITSSGDACTVSTTKGISTKNHSIYYLLSQQKNLRTSLIFRQRVSIVNLSAVAQPHLKYGAKKTNPNITVRGIDENYLFTGGFQM